MWVSWGGKYHWYDEPMPLGGRQGACHVAGTMHRWMYGYEERERPRNKDRCKRCVAALARREREDAQD